VTRAIRACNVRALAAGLARQASSTSRVTIGRDMDGSIPMERGRQ
jgi:hypothetical protein